MKPLCKFLPKLHKFHISQMSESNFRNLFPEFVSLSMRDGHFADSEIMSGDNDADDNVKITSRMMRQQGDARWKEMDFSELRCLFSQPRLRPAAGINNYRKKAFH